MYSSHEFVSYFKSVVLRVDLLNDSLFLEKYFILCMKFFFYLEGLDK